MSLVADRKASTLERVPCGTKSRSSRGGLKKRDVFDNHHAESLAARSVHVTDCFGITSRFDGQYIVFIGHVASTQSRPLSTGESSNATLQV